MSGSGILCWNISGPYILINIKMEFESLENNNRLLNITICQLIITKNLNKRGNSLNKFNHSYRFNKIS